MGSEGSPEQRGFEVRSTAGRPLVEKIPMERGVGFSHSSLISWSVVSTEIDLAIVPICFLGVYFDVADILKICASGSYNIMHH